MKNKIYQIVLSFTFTLTTIVVFAQQPTEVKKEAYTKVITKRADKIIETLDISDADKTIRVRDIIVDQYRNLSAVHDARDARIKSTGENKELDKEKVEARIAKIEKGTTAQLDKLHKKYLRKLSTELTPEKVDMVKDGMTYGVLPITYKGYLDMIPDLTEVQKKHIMTFLIEAREQAMDAGSAEKKHWWFGKYKGRINNYLSDAGYDLKKAGEDWQKRLQAGKTK